MRKREEVALYKNINVITLKTCLDIEQLKCNTHRNFEYRKISRYQKSSCGIFQLSAFKIQCDRWNFLHISALTWETMEVRQMGTSRIKWNEHFFNRILNCDEKLITYCCNKCSYYWLFHKDPLPLTAEPNIHQEKVLLCICWPTAASARWTNHHHLNLLSTAWQSCGHFKWKTACFGEQKRCCLPSG